MTASERRAVIGWPADRLTSDSENGDADPFPPRLQRRGKVANRRWIVRANGADAGVGGRLEQRGYAWDPRREVWFRTVDDADLVGEMIWLAAEVYASDVNPSSICPQVERVKQRRRAP